MVLKLDDDKVAQEQLGEHKEIGNDRGGGIHTVSRLHFLRASMLGGFGLLTWRLWSIQSPKFQTSLNDSTTTDPQLSIDSNYITSKAPRGIIYDRNNKRLVSNQASYSVTITANYLPDPDKGKNKDERNNLATQRQAVFDNLARFLGMNYFIVIVPEQINGLKNKQGQYTNPERNAILNELEILTGTSAQDWDKMLVNLANKGQDKDLLIVNEKEPIPIEEFDHYAELRTRFQTDGFLFQSEGELKMLQAFATVPSYQPVEVWSNLSREDSMLLTEKRLDYPGVDIAVNYIRQYENPRLFAHLLGYTGFFSSQDALVAANKAAAANAPVSTNPDDPSNKIDVYDIDDKIGVTGIESWMEEYLHGRKGANEVRVDNTGHILGTIRAGQPAQPGNNIVLTIDSDLQAFVADTLQQVLDSTDPKIVNTGAKVREGAAVVMDVTTGEVLSIVALPYYDNNLYNKPYKQWTDKEKADMANPDLSLETNRSVSARYAPGSCFKLITSTAALNEKVVNLNSTFNCTGLINVPTGLTPTPSQPFKCWGTHSAQTVVDAVKNSCDIFFYNSAVPAGHSDKSGDNRYYTVGSTTPVLFRGMGIDALNGYMSLYNVGKKTGVELPAEYQGILPGPQTTNPNFSIGDTMTTSIGQGDVEVTPLQMCMITASFANGGKLFQPRLVREVRDSDGKVMVPFEPKVIRDVTKDAVQWMMLDPTDPHHDRRIATDFRVEPAVLSAIRQGMLEVTSQTGTAASHMYGQVGSLKVAGKTGTAEYGEPISKDPVTKADQYATRAWFTAFAPFDNPKYAVTALIASGGVGAEGSTYAVPIVRDILKKLFPNETGANKGTPSPGATTSPKVTTPPKP